MSSFSEQGSIDPDNPKLDYTPLPLSERAAKLGPLVSQGASEPVRSSSVSRPASLDPEAINEPARRAHALNRRAALLSVVAVAGVAAAVALLFVIMKPASRQLVASPTPSETTGSISQLDQGDVESQPTLAKLKVTLPPSQPSTHEVSQQLLQRFLQWREKANMTEASQP
jgi:hypothetical protein